jgi:hypothetical protein
LIHSYCREREREKEEIKRKKREQGKASKINK